MAGTAVAVVGTMTVAPDGKFDVAIVDVAEVQIQSIAPVTGVAEVWAVLSVTALVAPAVAERT